jgi:TNF receptor-associated factor 3
MQSCGFKPEKCEFCEEKIASIKIQAHLNNDCPNCTIPCQYGCGTASKRAELQIHEDSCSQKPVDCKFHNAGCQFKGTEAQLSEHENAYMKEHLEILLVYLAKIENSKGELEKRLQTVENDRDIMKNKLKELLKENEVLKKKIDDLGNKMHQSQKMVAGTSEKVIKLEEEIKQFAKKEDIDLHVREISTFKKTHQDLQSRLDTMEQHSRSMDSGLGSSAVGLSSEVSQHDRLLSLFNVRLAEVDLRLQMLETASYNGTLMWKIRGYHRRKADAKSGKTISLYSQPFYTSPHGYKMCARVYLNGDGIGKGSHLSLFFVVMKGDYDALLPWPFRQKVTLMLLDQIGKRHLQDTFRPDPASSSFQKPQNEMNVASGCPLFVAHSVLEAEGTPYIRDETIFIKVVVDSEYLHDP